MKDYKELIEALRICSNNRLKDNAYFNMVSAADAIEQLVKERDAAVEDIKKNLMCASCAKRETGSEWGSYSGTHDPKYKGASRKGGSAKARSKTFTGIAKAMAEQWG